MRPPKEYVKEHKKWLKSSYVLARARAELSNLALTIDTSFYGKYGHFLAGEQGYPNVNYGNFLPIKGYLEPMEKSKMLNWSYERIIAMRVFTLYTKKRGAVHLTDRLSEKIKYSAMALKPHYAEVEFSKKPVLASTKDEPFGVVGIIKNIVEAENVSIPRKVYSLYYDEVNSSDAMEELYSRGFSIYYIQQLLSAGVLGKNKKVVPTRWAITAVDDFLSNLNKKEVLNYKSIDRIMLFTAERFYNRFVVILLPGTWFFENFEAWAPKTTWGAKSGVVITKEYETAVGRKHYAESQAGGYYATRSAVMEYLKRIKRQARVMVIREVYEGYVVPLGVWQVRENVRYALSKRPVVFDSMVELEEYVNTILRINFEEYVKRSTLLKQRTLLEF